MYSGLRTFNLAIAVLFPVAFLVGDLPDQEELHSTLFSTIYYAREFWEGRFPFWFAGLGLGIPQPFAHHLVVHPMLPLFALVDLRVALAGFFLFQTLLALFFMRLCCRQYGIERSVAELCTTTYLLSFVTFYMFFIKVSPVIYLVWTTLPLVIYLLNALALAQNKKEKLWYAVAFGLTSGVLLLNGHVGVLAAYSLLLVIYFLLFAGPRSLPYLLIGVVVGLAIASDKILLLWQEARVFDAYGDNGRAIRLDDFGMFAIWSLFLKPLVPIDILKVNPFPASWGALYHQFDVHVFIRSIALGGTTPRWVDNLFIGPPFVVLALAGLASRQFGTNLYLKIPILIGAVLLAVPQITPALVVVSGNIFFREIVVLLTIFLAGTVLTRMIGAPAQHQRLMARAVMFGQIAILVGAALLAYPRLQSFVLPGHTVVAAQAERDAAVIGPFLSSPLSRVYLSPAAAKTGPLSVRNWGGEANNALALMGVPTIGGVFKGVATSALYPAQRKMAGNVYPQASVLRDGSVLDVLGVEIVLAVSGEIWAKDLRPVGDLGTEEPVLVLRNDDVWPRVVELDRSAARLALDVRQGCDHDRLLCRDFAPVVALRRDARDIRATANGAGALTITLQKRPTETLLMVANSYRPGWRATDGDGNAIDSFEILGGLIGLNVPVGVARVSLVYRPMERVVATGFALAVLAGGIGFLVISGRRTRFSKWPVVELPVDLATPPPWRDVARVLMWYALLVGVAWLVGNIAYTAAVTWEVGWQNSEIVFAVSVLVVLLVSAPRLHRHMLARLASAVPGGSNDEE